MHVLVCADEEEAGARTDRDLSPTPSTLLQALIPNLCIPELLKLQQGSVVAPPKLLAIGN